MAVSVDQAAEDFKRDIDKFVEAYKTKHAVSPTEYPLALPDVIVFCFFETFAAFGALAMWDRLADERFGNFVLAGSIAWIALLAILMFVAITRALRAKRTSSGF